MKNFFLYGEFIAEKVIIGYNVTEVKVMDCKRTGELIRLLRTEKNMTQKQLADQVMVSDKAVSKWETGVSQT